MNRIKLSAVFLLLCTLSTTVFAQTGGKQMPFQGTFYENGIAFTGNKTFTFTIELGDNDWTETQEDILIVEGLYSVTLGDVNPIPYDIFHDAESRELTVAVGNTTLGTTTIFAPFSLATEDSFGKGSFKLEAKAEGDSAALVAEIYGPGVGSSKAIEGVAKTDTTLNIGVNGVALAGPTNTKQNYGVRGYSYSQTPQSWSTGVIGVGAANGAGAVYGVRGQVEGSNLDFSAGLRGLNFAATPEAGGDRYGAYFNTYAGQNGLYKGRSLGVRGSATGSSQNIGVFGSAFGEGSENYSGWFEGGELILNNVSALNFWGDNPYLRFKVSGRGDEGWPTDTNGHGQISIDGPNGANMYFGAKVWEEGGANRPVFQMYGSPIQDPNNADQTYNPEAVFMTVNDFGDGAEQGMLQLGKVGQSSAILNRDNLKSLTQMVDGNGKYRFEVNEQNSGVLKLMSSVDSVNVLIDSNGEKAGLMFLNDSLGRESMGLISYPGNTSQLRMWAGTPDNGGTSITAQYVSGLNPYVNLIGRNADGSAIGRAQMGRLGGFAGNGFRVTDGDNRWLATMQGDATNGGAITLEGPSTPNFWLGQKNWENSNLPYMGMRGENEVTNGNDTYVPDGLSFEVSRYGDGSDVGVINFRRILNGNEEGVTLDYFNVNELINGDAKRIRGVNGNDVAVLSRRGDNFGQANFFNDNNGLRAEIGSFGDNSGFMQLYGPNGGKNLQMGGSDGNRNYGMLRLSGTTENNLINLEIRDNNGEEAPTIELRSPSNNSNISIGLDKDPNASNALTSYLNLEGPNSPLIHMGAMPWESNDGANRARLGLFGNDQVSDGNGGTYTPERISMNVSEDGSGSEFGTISVKNTNGGGFEIGSRSWENNNQGAGNTYTAILSTIDFTNNAGDTYRPWLISQQFHDTGNGTQYGTIDIRSVSSSTDDGKIELNPGNSGDINISGSLNQSSDARLKKNITGLTSGLATIQQLRGVRYNWKDETRTDDKIGFIAQEVEKVLPELVVTKEDGYKAVSYAEMTAVLVEAVKELSQQVEELKQENSNLKAEASKVSALEDRLALIEQMLMNNSKKVNSDQK